MAIEISNRKTMGEVGLLLLAVLVPTVVMVKVPEPYTLPVALSVFPVFLVWSKWTTRRQRQRNGGLTDREADLAERVETWGREPGFATEWIMVQRLAVPYEVVKTTGGFYFCRGGWRRTGVTDDQLRLAYPNGDAPVRSGKDFFVPRNDMNNAQISYGAGSESEIDQCGNLRFQRGGKIRRFIILGAASKEELRDFFHPYSID